MTTTVSFTDFRDNLSDHLDYLKAGNSIVIKNVKKDEEVVTLVAEKKEEFDWDRHIKWMKSFKPFLTDEDVKDYKERRKKSKLRLKRNNW